MHGRLQGRTVRIGWGIAGGCSNRREECYDFQRIKDTPSGSSRLLKNELPQSFSLFRLPPKRCSDCANEPH